jgi:hypothetical protein
MSTLETILIAVLAVTTVLAPKAIDAWLSRRDVARASREESMLNRAVGGAD